MTMLMDAYRIVKANATWADSVYVKKLDKSQITPDKTFVLVRDGVQSQSLFGSNTYTQMTYGVDIQIWYSTSSTLDYDAVEQNLMKTLEAQGWRVQTIRGRIVDPDAFQDFQTITFAKTKETI